MHYAPTSDEATKRWPHFEVDTDATIPVELYSRPYERIDVDEHPAAGIPRAVPSAPPRTLVAALCVTAFFGGFGLVVLLGGCGP